MSNEYRDMLCELLNCGYADVEMLKECRYYFDDIKDEIRNNYGSCEIEFNNLLNGAISMYQSHIQRAIDSRIFDLECNINEIEQLNDEHVEITKENKELYDRLWQEKNELEQLNAFDDIGYYVNYLDTSIYINDDEIKALYRKHLKDIIDEENDEIGFVSLDVGSDK